MLEQYDIHIISLLILAVVLFNNIKNGTDNRSRQRLFRCLVIFDMFFIIINAADIVLKQNADSMTIRFYLETVFLFLCVLFCELWAAFCTYRSGRRIKTRGLIVISLPLLAVAVLLVFNLNNQMVLTHKNERGPLFHTLTAVVLFYIVYSFIITWRGKKNMDQREYYPYLVGPALIAALGIAKLVLWCEETVLWPLVAIGLLVLQLFALDEKMNLDHLTGLHNRKYLDTYIEELISVYRNAQGTHENRNFAALMLDLDNFKSINDTYGHVHGDKVLISASRLLKKSVRRGDFVARYGGDEFMIVLDRCGPQTPERVIRRLKENVNQYNAENKLPYELSFSIGCKIFTNVKGLTAKDIFKTIDELMYVHKQNKAASTSKYTGIQT